MEGLVRKKSRWSKMKFWLRKKKRVGRSYMEEDRKEGRRMKRRRVE